MGVPFASRNWLTQIRGSVLKAILKEVNDSTSSSLSNLWTKYWGVFLIFAEPEELTIVRFYKRNLYEHSLIIFKNLQHYQLLVYVDLKRSISCDLNKFQSFLYEFVLEFLNLPIWKSKKC